MAKRLSTKILSGSFKGKSIYLPSKEVTRSSKAILRESLFNTLQQEIVGFSFVELFGGSGAVGLEALSRGAKMAYFIERDADSFAVLKDNAKIIDEKRCRLFFGDAFEKVEEIVRLLEKSGETAFFYADPPFSIRAGMEDIYERVFAILAKIPPALTRAIIIEHMSAIAMLPRIGPYVMVKQRKFGKSTLSYYACQTGENHD